ncbi:MAG: hypothetical protein RL693_1264, partial [Verrucomicrobiota bacterium]
MRERDKGKGIRNKGESCDFVSRFRQERRGRDKGKGIRDKWVGIFWCLLSLTLTLQGAEDQSDTIGKVASHQSSLGVPFVPIEGTPVLFARWETRVSDFETFVKEANYAWNEKPYFPQTGDHPAVNVNFQDAGAFCEWLTKRERASGTLNEKQSYRLPTNAEWDLASGVELQTDATKKDPVVSFPGGKEWPPSPRAGNFNSQELDGTDDGFANTAPVGRFQTGGKGLDDLAGNVWEWTQDETAKSGDGTLRGGSWQYFNKESLRSDYRYVVPSKLRRSSIGFRCVFDDKARAETLLAQKKRQLLEKGEELTARSKATKEEVDQLKNKMSEKSGLTAEEKLAAKNRLLNDRSDRESFVNSLGITFLPLKDGSGLLSTRELRPRDLAAWVS